jgi:hypothetical protein
VAVQRAAEVSQSMVVQRNEGVAKDQGQALQKRTKPALSP